jgi:hypothetical protein
MGAALIAVMIDASLSLMNATLTEFYRKPGKLVR